MCLAKQQVTEIAKELMAQPIERGVVWNVNFPDGESRICRGILRDRTVAPTWLYSGSYREKEKENDITVLKIGGEPLTAEDPIAEGSDMEAVLKGYISIGKVKGVVF